MLRSVCRALVRTGAHAPRMMSTVGHADRICGDSISGNRRRTEELSVVPDDVIRTYFTGPATR